MTMLDILFFSFLGCICLCLLFAILTMKGIFHTTIPCFVVIIVSILYGVILFNNDTLIRIAEYDMAYAEKSLKQLEVYCSHQVSKAGTLKCNNLEHQYKKLRAEAKDRYDWYIIGKFSD